MSSIRIERTGITSLSTDAVVNAASTGLCAGSGVCSAIFAAAGYAKLQAACKAIGHCEVGSAVITPAFDLNAKYIIHAVGPVWSGEDFEKEKQLYNAYRCALELAVSHGCASVGFPLISAGTFGYPVEPAWRVALQACRDFLQIHQETELEIVFSVIDTKVAAIGEAYLRRSNVQRGKVDRLLCGEKTVDAVFFNLPGETNGYLSNDFQAGFVMNGVRFTSPGQYIVYRKCLLFGDVENANLILATEDPFRQKAIGRRAAGFQAAVWDGRKQIIVYQALMAKFEQNEALRLQLQNTGSACLVNCVPRDMVWSCGYGPEHPNRLDMSQWRGENLLGFALMEVREALLSQGKARSSEQEYMKWGKERL